MKKVAAALAFAVALTSGVAFADTIQNGYGNTFVVTTADGGTLNYYFNQDGTFSATANGQTVASGTYQVANGQLCVVTAAGGQPACSAYVGDKNVGDSWSQTAGDGSTIGVELRAGR